MLLTNFRYFLSAMVILATLSVSIWLAAAYEMFVKFLMGIVDMMFLFYIFTHTIGFTVVLYSIIKHNQKQRQSQPKITLL